MYIIYIYILYIVLYYHTTVTKLLYYNYLLYYKYVIIMLSYNIIL